MGDLLGRPCRAVSQNITQRRSCTAALSPHGGVPEEEVSCSRDTRSLARRLLHSREVVAMARKKKFEMQKEIRKLARERVGTVPSSRPIEPKSQRKKPKHK